MIATALLVPSTATAPPTATFDDSTRLQRVQRPGDDQPVDRHVQLPGQLPRTRPVLEVPRARRTTAWKSEGSFDFTPPAGATVTFTGNAGDGVQQIIWDCTAGNVNQQYTLTTSGELGIAGKCLGSCNGTPSRRWSFRAAGTLVDELSGTCLDVTGQGTVNGSRVRLWQCTDAANQKWGRR